MHGGRKLDAKPVSGFRVMKTYRFNARIGVLAGGAAITFPFGVEVEFGMRGSVPVQATIDGVAYRGSVAKCGSRPHMLGVLKSIRWQISKGAGDASRSLFGRTTLFESSRSPRNSRNC